MKKLLLILSVCLFTASAFAQEAAKFDPFISIRAWYGYHDMDLPKGSTVADNELDQSYRLQANSRFGTMFAAGNVKGIFELGLQNHATSSTPANYAYLRLLNATYDFGGLKLTVGQDYTPYTWIPAAADQVDDNSLGGFGATYDGRTPLVKVDVQGLYVAFIAPCRTLGATAAGYGTGTITAADTTALYPKIAVGYDYKAEGVIVGFGGAYNSVKINDETSDLDNENIVSYLGYVHGDLSFGIIGIKFNFGYGQNMGNFGEVLGPIAGTGNAPDTLASTSTFVRNSAYAYNDGGDVKNSTHIEGYVDLIIKLDPITISGAVGYQSDKLDVTGAKADKQMIYAVDIKYAVDKNLSFVPLFSYRDYMKDAYNDDQGSEYYAGVKIQFDVK